MKRWVGALCLMIAAGCAPAQWTLENSGVTADFRGIEYVGNGVAWASGNHGTVLRTVDMGKTWTRCATPAGAEELDFRGVQAFDEKTAIVMSSGKGELSRLYKTVDGCHKWKLLFTNTDPDGFWDALRFADKDHGFLLGDPVAVAGSTKKRVVLKQTRNGGKTWISWERTVEEFALGDDVSAFAASNSALIAIDRFHAVIAVGGKGGSALGFPGNNEFVTDKSFCSSCPIASERKATTKLNVLWLLDGPFPKTNSGGIFAIAQHENHVIAVGGDYKEPLSAEQTAAVFIAAGHGGDWHFTQTPPYGYRSAVAYDKSSDTWITVGPNGTDISTDDGRNWRALKPGPGDDQEADQHWNALSLPFAVGPKGRIGVLRAEALKKDADSSAPLRNDKRR